MNKTILIAPYDGPLASSLAAEARAAGWSVALALPGGDRRAAADGSGAAEGDPAPPAGPETVTLTYNPASFVSIAALVLAARNALGEIDAAAMVADPSQLGPDFIAAKPGELGLLVEERCSSHLFLSRELAKRFEARKRGTMLLLAPERPKDAATGPAAAMAAGAFTGLGEGLFSASVSAPWSAFGVIDATGQPDRAARHALGLLSESLPQGEMTGTAPTAGRAGAPRPAAKHPKAGRWIRYTGKSGIFGQG